MKADARRIRSALAAPGDVRLFLLHGPDAAGAAELAALLATAMGPEAERIDLDGATLAKDPARLADEAASLSLFGSVRHVRVTGVGDESVAAIEALLSAQRGGHPVVAIAPTARTTSRLVKLAIASPHVLAHGCYEPDAQEAERIAAALAREAGLVVQAGVARRLVSAVGGDRALLRREVEKLALYLDAAPDREAPLGHDALDAVGADAGDSEAATLVAAVVEGRADDLGGELARLDMAGASAVTWLRALARRLVTLAEIRGEIDAGRSAEAAMTRHRVFGREAAATERLARRWSAPLLARALARTQAAERAMTAAATAGPVMAEQAVLAMARALARE